MGSVKVAQLAPATVAAAAPQEPSGPQARPQTPKPPDVLVVFNLGDDFAVQGHGITTRLDALDAPDRPRDRTTRLDAHGTTRITRTQITRRLQPSPADR